MEPLGGIIPAIIFGISMLVNLALIVFFVYQKNNVERLHFLILVAIVLFIVYASSGVFSDYFYTPEWSFTFTQMVIISFLVMVSKTLALNRVVVGILLLVYFLALGTNQFWAQILATTAYLINSYWFIQSAYQKVFPPKRSFLE